MILKILYVKWVLRECPHFCRLCKFRKTEYGSCMWDMSEADIKTIKANRKDYKRWKKSLKKKKTTEKF